MGKLVEIFVTIFTKLKEKVLIAAAEIGVIESESSSGQHLSSI